MKKVIYIVIGCIFLCLGVIGIALPVVPQVPFLLLALFCFSKSSQRLRNWLLNTKMGKKYLAEKQKFNIKASDVIMMILLSVEAVMLLIPAIFIGDIIEWKTGSTLLLPLLYYSLVCVLYGMTFFSNHIAVFWIKWWLTLPLSYLAMQYFWSLDYSIRSYQWVFGVDESQAAGGRMDGAYRLLILVAMSFIALCIAFYCSCKKKNIPMITFNQKYICAIFGMANLLIAALLEHLF